MGILKKIGLTIGIIILLFIGFVGAVWVFNPFAKTILVSDPEPFGQRINENGLIANYYPVEGPGKYPAIVLLGGSEGGIGAGVTRIAQEFQKQNYAVLVVSYFGAPGQAGKLELIPLELFDKAINWIKSQPNIDEHALAVMGASKGAEAALIVATRRPELRTVIVGMPSSVAWQGYNPNLLKQIVTPPDGSWSLNGKAIPFVPYVKEYVNGPFELYSKSLAEASIYPDAIIPVEKITGSVMLICGELDSLWTSCDMSRQIEKRAQKRGGPKVHLLAYREAGHAGFGIPLEPDHPRFEVLASVGGTAGDNNNARKDGWEKILAHLQTAFEASRAD